MLHYALLYQKIAQAKRRAWEEDRFNNTSFKEASEIQVPQKENLSGTNTWLQTGGYGSGQLIEAMKAKRERDNTGEFKEKTKLDGEHDQHKQDNQLHLIQEQRGEQENIKFSKTYILI